jgi:hypothetical protein
MQDERSSSDWPGTEILGKSKTCLSEIPCRVSNIARGGGDTVFKQPAQIGEAHTVPLAGAPRVIPRVRPNVSSDPVTTQGMRSLDGRKAITRRP